MKPWEKYPGSDGPWSKFSAPKQAGSVDGLGIAEAGLTAASSIAAEPIAGIAGIASSVVSGGAEGGQTVRDVREAMTYQPRTEGGKAAISELGDTLAPVAEGFGAVESALGDSVFEATGSPALAAFAKSVPTAALELIGVGFGKGALKMKGGPDVDGALVASAPSVDDLKKTSRAVYKEIDDLGVTLTPQAAQSLSARVKDATKTMGVDPDVTPKAAKAIERISALDDAGSVTLTDIENLRRIAGNAAGAIEGGDKAIGSRIVDTIDDFLEEAGDSMLAKPSGVDIGERYKAARNLWGRARKSELLDDAMSKARNQASGFENGIRTQFRSILNNKKKSRMFSKDEIAAMERVVQGGKGENLFRLIGRVSPTEGAAHNMLQSGIGAGAGFALFGPAGAVAVPAIGYVSRQLAQRLTRKSAEFANAIIRAGNDGQKIATAYLTKTPKEARKAEELAQLLLRDGVTTDRVSGEFAKQAAEFADDVKANAF